MVEILLVQPEKQHNNVRFLLVSADTGQLESPHRREPLDDLLLQVVVGVFPHHRWLGRTWTLTSRSNEYSLVTICGGPRMGTGRIRERVLRVYLPKARHAESRLLK